MLLHLWRMAVDNVVQFNRVMMIGALSAFIEACFGGEGAVLVVKICKREIIGYHGTPFFPSYSGGSSDMYKSLQIIENIRQHEMQESPQPTA